MERVLVTGIGGYVGLHVARVLLDSGRAVRGTVRTAARADATRALLGAAEPLLTLVRADLDRDDGWAEAARGCRFVVHVASPVPLTPPRHDDDVVRPARDGTLRVMRAALAAGVERVVVTSSLAAVVAGHPHERVAFADDDWALPDSPNVDAYSKAKTLAERAAWDFAGRERIGLVTLQPPYLFGPLLGPEPSPSLQWILRLMRREVPGIPDLGVPCADVRDVALAHVRALEVPEAAGHRFGLTAWAPRFVDIAHALAKAYPDRRIRTRPVPRWLVRVVATFDPNARQVVPAIGRRFAVDCRRAQSVLAFSPRPLEDTLLDTCRSLEAYGLVG